MSNLQQLRTDLKKLANPQRAEISKWFFKTAPGQYGAGDKFIGITVPLQRKVAEKYWQISFKDLKKLLSSKIHEHRFVALEILVFKYERGKPAEKKQVFNFYRQHLGFVNNWDLVDTSAPYILGDYLLNRDKSLLPRLARSKLLWDRRIAMVSTLRLIQNGKFQETLNIAKILLKDRQDLIHKACGWMLRELGKRSPQTELKFLDKYAAKMPRTMLRYAIERLPQKQRKYYLTKSE